MALASRTPNLTSPLVKRLAAATSLWDRFSRAGRAAGSGVLQKTAVDLWSRKKYAQISGETKKFLGIFAPSIKRSPKAVWDAFASQTWSRGNLENIATALAGSQPFPSLEASVQEKFHKAAARLLAGNGITPPKIPPSQEVVTQERGSLAVPLLIGTGLLGLGLLIYSRKG